MSHMPEFIAPQRFTDAGAALEQVERIYKSGLKHLRDAMQDFVAGEDMPGRVRACYPFVRVHTHTSARGTAVNGLSYGFVAGPGRFELRLPDGAANPYLMQAVIIAAGLDGIRSKADPGKRHDIDMYQFGHTVKGAPKLPLNLLDALREFDKDKSLKAALGEEFSSAYLKLKHQEWNSYASHFTQWERDHTLDI